MKIITIKKILILSVLFTLVSCGSSDSGEKVNRVIFTDEDASGMPKLYEFNPDTEATRIVGEGFYDEVDYDYDVEYPVTVVHKGLVYFSGYTAAAGYELWQYDPRKKDALGINPKMVVDLNPGINDSSPYSFKSFGDLLLYQGETATDGKELIIYNPKKSISPTNPHVVDIYVGASDSRPENLVTYRGKVYFYARSAAAGAELWEIDPTAPINVGVNPKMVADINPGTANSSPYYLAVHNDVLYFRATTSANGTELWSYDVDQPISASNPVEVVDLVSGASSSSPYSMNSIGDKLFFSAASTSFGQELWSYDPNQAISGTNPEVYDFRVGTLSTRPNFSVADGNKIYYAGRTSNDEEELFVFDTTLPLNAGTNPLMVDLNPSTINEADPWLFTKCLNKKLCFSAENAATGNFTLRVLDLTASPATGADVMEFNDHSGTSASDIINYSANK